jgi:hypothetical protein
MIRFPLLVPLLLAVLLLTGCPYDNAPSGPSRNIDTWLVGQWETRDKAGHSLAAVVAPSVPDHYSVTLNRSGKAPESYDAWISRVDGFTILVLKFLDGPSAGKYALFHHELLTPGTPRPGGIGATRIRLSELQLDPSAETLDSYHLRRDIRDALKAGTLLAPYDIVSDRKQGGAVTPGSVIWTKTGSVTLRGETF